MANNRIILGWGFEKRTRPLIHEGRHQPPPLHPPPLHPSHNRRSPPESLNTLMASISPATASAAVAGAHRRALPPSSLGHLHKPRPRLRLAACHADTLPPSSQGARAPPSLAVGPSAVESSATDVFSDWLRSHGLPAGKVAIRERPVPCTLEGKGLPLRHVAAGEDLQVGRA
jgi:hypothetical protein